MSINADVRFKKMTDKRPIEQAGPEIVARDADGNLVGIVTDDDSRLKERFIKDTASDKNEALEPVEGEHLGRGTVTYTHVNENGETVPKEEVSYYQVDPESGEEEPVEKKDPTIGGGRKLEPQKWIDSSSMEEYLTSKTYEMWGETEEDQAELYELAKYIEEQGEAPMIYWAYQSRWTYMYGIITPEFHEQGDKFSMIVTITGQKVVPEHDMPTMSMEEVQKAHDEDSGTVDQPEL